MDRTKRPSPERVVITGMGIFSPIGNDLQTVWDSLMHGRSGINLVDRFDVSDLPSQMAGMVDDFTPGDFMTAKEARRADRYVQLAVAAAKDAVQNARLDINEANADRIGVIVGTALGGIGTAERELSALENRGPGRVSPFFIPMYLGDMASGYASIATGARGPNYAILSACASASHAIGESMHIIRRGDADVMLAGGAEAAVTRGSIAGFAAVGALSKRNDDPTTASRPFDESRDGFVIAEGSAVLVLESLQHAQSRGATVLAEVSGYGASGDACHIVQPAPDGNGGARAMQLALKSSGLAPEQIGYINAHGTSTPLNDRLETLSIKTVFGTQKPPPVSSTKALTGHLLGAGGGIEAIFCVQAIQNRKVPPTWHLNHPDPNCDLDYVANHPRDRELDHVFSNSLGFGGHNITLAFSRFTE